MTKLNTTHRTRSMYSKVWQHTGPGILIALMFVIVASATLLREQSAAMASIGNSRHDTAIAEQLTNLRFGQNREIRHSVQRAIPLQQLQDADGRISAKGDSLFMLLARRMESLSLTVTFTTKSYEDAEFAAKIAARMMNAVPLEATQLRIGVDEPGYDSATPIESTLAITIARNEVVDGGIE